MRRIFCLVLLITFFAGNIFASNVQAKIETFEGSGAYPITDEKTHGEVKDLAKKEAIRDALNKAGVAVYSQVTVKNNVLTEDVIKITAGTILKVLDDKYKFIPVEEDDGIGMYKAIVTISIDTDELNKKLQDFLNKESIEQSTLASQYEELQKLNDANTKRIAELEKQLSEKNSAQNIQQIKNEIAGIDKDTLYAQKMDEGWKAWNNKNFEQALKLFDEAVNLKADDYQGYFGRGTSQVDLKNYTEAVKDLNKSIQLGANMSNLYNNRGIAYKNLKNYEQAISDYNQALKINSNNALAYNNRGNIYLDLKNYKQAISDLNQAIKINPNYALAYRNRGIVYADLKNYTQAISDYTKAIKLNPNYADAYNNRGLAYLDLKNYDQAISDFNQAIKLNSNYYQAYNNRGLTHYRSQNHNQAISDYTQAIKLNPNYALAYNNRALAYKKLGDNMQAEKDFAKAKELGYKG